MTELLLGIDLATAHARVVVCDLDGRTRGSATRPLPSPVRKGGRSRQRADYWPVVAELLAEQLALLGPAAAEVSAIALTGTSGSLVPCDDHGRPTGNASLYDDVVPEDELRRLRDRGISVGATSPLARLAWLNTHEPAATYVHPSDVVNAALAGSAVPTDTSHALKEGVDLLHGVRDTALLARAGVQEQDLPPLVRPGTVLGQVDPTIAGELGLPRGVRVIAGMTDGCTAQIAAGAVDEGTTVGVLGTTLVLKAVSTTELTALDGVVYSHRAPDGRFWPGGASNVGAAAVSQGFPGMDLQALDEQAEKHGPATQVRYPLAAAGERFPFRAPDAVGFAVPLPGMQPQESGPDSYRAVLEGVAFVERLGLETLQDFGVRTGDHRVVGGGSTSRVWNAIRATVLGQPVRRTQNPQSAFGAAVLAASAVDGGKLTATIDRMVHVVETVDPVADEVEPLEERYQLLCGELRRRGLLPEERATTTRTPARKGMP